MIKVMFICHGNICRSPMAQSVFSHYVKQEGKEEHFLIDSSATSREEISNPPHHGTKKILSKKNIPLIDHRAKQITNEDAENFDLLICMDNNNVYNLKKIIHEDHHSKISLLLEYANINRDIRDPWYTGNFFETFEDINIGCKALLKTLSQKITS